MFLKIPNHLKFINKSVIFFITIFCNTKQIFFVKTREQLKKIVESKKKIILLKSKIYSGIARAISTRFIYASDCKSYSRFDEFGKKQEFSPFVHREETMNTLKNLDILQNDFRKQCEGEKDFAFLCEESGSKIKTALDKIKTEEQINLEAKIFDDFENKIIELSQKFYSFFDVIIKNTSSLNQNTFFISKKDKPFINEELIFENITKTILAQSEKSVDKIFILNDFFTKLSETDQLTLSLIKDFFENTKKNPTLKIFSKTELKHLDNLFKQLILLNQLSKEPLLTKITKQESFSEAVSSKIMRIFGNHIFDFAADYFEFCVFLLNSKNIIFDEARPKFSHLYQRHRILFCQLEQLLKTAKKMNSLFNEEPKPEVTWKPTINRFRKRL